MSGVYAQVQIYLSEARDMRTKLNLGIVEYHEKGRRERY
jgi:hypothetical protein